MYTDWLIVRRLAAELERAVGSARIREVGVTADGRFALRVRARGAGGDAIVIDAFGDTPVVTLEHGIQLSVEHGWTRSIADAVAGMRIEGIRTRTGDRLISLHLATISRFGVLSSYGLIAELEPRFGNVLLLKGDVIVTAARTFTPEQNPRRPVIVGYPYEPPPLPQAVLNRTQLAEALAPLLTGTDAEAQSVAARAVRKHLPLVPYLVAASAIARAVATQATSAGVLAERVIAEAEYLLNAADADDSAPVYAYRDRERIVQAHVVPLDQYAALSSERSDSMLDVVAHVLRRNRDDVFARNGEARREALLVRVRRRLGTLAEERGSLERALTEDSPERLRIEGELLYAHEAAVPIGATTFVPPSEPGLTIALDPELDAKANAAAIFKRYRKALGRKNHAESRLTSLASQIAAAEELIWELERADVATLEELSEDADRIEQRGGGPHARPGARRGAMEVTLSNDARVLVGRSPQNNAEVTFRMARPDDLWFHARGVPGAHVVLRIDSARAPTSAELQSAAQLAAYHSKARTSGLVPVDYTARKHVRKQRSALPGLVWYTNAKTIDVMPRGAN